MFVYSNDRVPYRWKTGFKRVRNAIQQVGPYYRQAQIFQHLGEESLARILLDVHSERTSKGKGAIGDCSHHTSLRQFVPDGR